MHAMALAARRLDPGRADRRAHGDPRSRSAGCGSPSASCSCSRGSRSPSVPQRRVVIAIAFGVGRARARGLGHPPAARAPGGGRGPGVESPGRGPGALDCVPRGAARGDRGRVRAHPGREARAEPDLQDTRHAGVLARWTASTAVATSSSGCARRDHLDGVDDARRKARRTIVSGPHVSRGFGEARVHRHLPDRPHAARRRLRAGRAVSAAAPDDHAPEPMRLDTKPPVDRVSAHQIYTPISPDGDGHKDAFRVPYTLNGPAHAILLVNGRQVGFTRAQAPGATSTGTGCSTDVRPGPAITCSRPPPRRGRQHARSRSRSRSSGSATSGSARTASWSRPGHALRGPRAHRRAGR